MAGMTVLLGGWFENERNSAVMVIEEVYVVVSPMMDGLE